MKISLDAGGVCATKERRFGNYTFTLNLVNALKRFDNINDYLFYSFCKKPESFPEWVKGHYRFLRPTKGWMKLRVTFEEIFHPSDCFLGLNQAIPLFLKKKPIIFLHGLSFHFFPQYYPDSYNELEEQLKNAVKGSKYIVVSSKKVKQELRGIFPRISNIVVLPYGIPFDMSIQRQTRRAKKKYFLYVGMNNQIKNKEFILKVFNKLISSEQYKDYHLYLVGPHESVNNKNVTIFRTVSRKKLKSLYQEATALLTSSYYESFNFPVLEALSQSCQVIGTRSAIIPELQKFAHLSDDKHSFLSIMKRVIDEKTMIIDISRLKKEFSWKSYIKKLITLYS